MDTVLISAALFLIFLVGVIWNISLSASRRSKKPNKPSLEQLEKENRDLLLGLTVQRNEKRALSEKFDREIHALEIAIKNKDEEIARLTIQNKLSQSTVTQMFSSCDDLHLMEICHDQEVELAKKDHIITSLKRGQAWGDILKSYGNDKYNLSPHEKEMIHFPPFDSSKVFFSRHGKRFHSVPWCYTLDSTEYLNYSTVESAIRSGLKPCSKCIDIDDFQDHFDDYFDDSDS